jgi:ribosomal-protein-alanine N-acetyltransferase
MAGFSAWEFELRYPEEANLAEISAIHATTEGATAHPLGTAEETNHAWIHDWQRDGIGYWVVVARGSGDHHAPRAGSVVGVGGVRYQHLGGAGVFNLFCRLVPRVWGRGWARHLALHALRTANEHDPSTAVVVRSHPTNQISEKVALAIGLRHLGRDDSGRAVLADRLLDAATLRPLSLDSI